MECEVVRLGNILEIFEENKGVDDIGPQSFFFFFKFGRVFSERNAHDPD